MESKTKAVDYLSATVLCASTLSHCHKEASLIIGRGLNPGGDKKRGWDGRGK